MTFALAGAAATAAVWFVVAAAPPAVETVATPTPGPAHTTKTTPVTPTRGAGPPRIVVPRLLDAEGAAAAVVADGGQGASGKLERAWRTPGMGGHVFLVRKGSDWCLSVTDPAGEAPGDRGISCSTDRTYRRFGVSVTVGDSYAAAIPPGNPAPTYRPPGGKSRPLDVAPGGLVAIIRTADGSAVALRASDGGRRTDAFRAEPQRVRHHCSDGSAVDIPLSARPGSDPCVARRNPPPVPDYTPPLQLGGRGG
jgi:hypothetical protein